MKNLRPVIAAVVALLFYTTVDIMIWQRIFEANNMSEYASMYHSGWFISLAGYAIMGVLLMWGAWKDCAFFLITLFVGAFSGLEDMLYYVLDRKPMPESLPWLANNPMIYQASRTGVLVSVTFWIGSLIFLYFLFYRRPRPSQQPLQMDISE